MKIIAVTNRLLCKNNFLIQIKNICKAGVYAVILREKDLSDTEYEKLAVECNKICSAYNVLLFINTKYKIAQKLGIKNIQLSFNDFINNKNLTDYFNNIAVSVHSVEEAVTAQKHNASFIIAGHVFETDCKKGLKPRGTEFIKSITEKISVPVYAIGGISPENIHLLKPAGITGICLMSSLMTADKPEEIIDNINCTYTTG